MLHESELAEGLASLHRCPYLMTTSRRNFISTKIQTRRDLLEELDTAPRSPTLVPEKLGACL
jgi:hypothetical protein